MVDVHLSGERGRREEGQNHHEHQKQRYKTLLVHMISYSFLFEFPVIRVKQECQPYPCNLLPRQIVVQCELHHSSLTS